MKRILGVGCLMLLLAATANAQQNQVGGRRGGGFGGRGMGGGPAILQIPEVQKEVLLTDDQKTKVTEVLTKAQEDLRGSFNFQELQGLEQAERDKKMAEFNAKREESNKQVTDQISQILDAKQFARFQELRLQRDGVQALTQAPVAEKLALTQEQKDKLAALQAEGRQAFGQGGGNFANLSDEERRAAFEKMRAAGEKRNADMLAVLTPEQKETWEKMLGEKFDFPQRGPGGPGGGQGGGQRQRPDTKKAE